jgi:hypothetical protein
LAWVPLGFSAIIVIDRDLTSSSAQELLGEFDLVIVNYNYEHFVTWLKYILLYAENAISTNSIVANIWHKALSKTRHVRRLQAKLPDNPFGSESQLTERNQSTSRGDSDLTSADIQEANASLADALQSYDPTESSFMRTCRTPPIFYL